MIQYFSTNNPKIKVSLEHAVLTGLPKDKGLYLPDNLPVIDSSFISEQKTFQEMAYEISKHFLHPTFSFSEIELIIQRAMNFDVPVHFLEEPNLSIAELFHGPTAAFKDFGARFMSEILAAIVQKRGEKITILVATSGDTGGAVGRGFLNIPNIDVVLLYPSKKVSLLQEKQLTTLGNNITALEIDGVFDDCQQLVKTAFLDKEINNNRNLSSANSINICRLIPQSFYYAFCSQQLYIQTKKKVSFSIPSGNFGNLTAAFLAKKMGFPIHHFIGAVNANQVFTDYLNHGTYLPKPSVKTISNAMDVGKPNNFVRLSWFFNNDVNRFKKHISSYSFTDEKTKRAIKEVYDKYGYVIDPHTSVGYLAYKQHTLLKQEEPFVIMSTAHPAKFSEIVEKVLKKKINIPDNLLECLTKKKKSIFLSNSFKDFKAFLLKS